MAVIQLTAGDDTYTATGAGDSVFGLGGNDTITATDGGNQLYGGEGDDTLNGGDGNDTLVGDDSTNTSYHNIMRGFGGDDLITSYSWYDSIAGGQGNDTVVVYAMTTGQVVDGGGGSDTITIYALSQQTAPVHLVMGSTFSPTVGGINGATYTNFETLNYLGGTGSSTIEGGAGNDFIAADNANVGLFDAGSLKGWGGDDRLQFNGYPNPGTGIERIDGGDGNDTFAWSTGFNYSVSNLSVDFTNGKMKADGTIFADFTNIEILNIYFNNNGAGTATISGGDSADQIQIIAASSDIEGNGGDDQIFIQTGSATAYGGEGNDHISTPFTSADSHTFRGGTGNDTIAGGQGQDQIYGEDGNDVLSAYNVKSNVYGGSGDDTVLSYSSATTLGSNPGTINGGGGRDVLTIQRYLYASAFTVDFSGADITLDDGTHIINCEAINFWSGSANDVLKSSNDAAGNAVNKLLGAAGDDTLTASANGATLDGGFGDDMLIAGAGADILIGYTNSAVGDTVSYANSIKGVTVDLNLLTAQGGKGDAKGDTLSGIENLLGSAHDDRLTGNAIANVLNGGDGNDKLTGGLGKDTLTGGTGKDTFIYSGASDSSGVGFDSVTDFDADKDHFQVIAAVTAIDNKVGHGNLTLAAFDADLGAALAGKLHAGRAILFTPDAGDYPAHTFLIIDQNGVAGYQSGGDIVLDTTGANNLSSLSIADFTT